jgi:hypothetical protein
LIDISNHCAKFLSLNLSDRHYHCYIDEMINWQKGISPLNCMNSGVSDPWFWEAIQGGLKGGKNDYVGRGCGAGMVRRAEEGARG